FKAALRERPEDDYGCWACGPSDPHLIYLNVRKDLVSLRVAADDCPPAVLLCLGCAYEYMSSFNAALLKRERKQARRAAARRSSQPAGVSDRRSAPDVPVADSDHMGG